MNPITAAITLVCVAVFVAVMYALRYWVDVLDGRLFMDNIIPVAADVAANEPTVIARFGYDTNTETRAA